MISKACLPPPPIQYSVSPEFSYHNNTGKSEGMVATKNEPTTSDKANNRKNENNKNNMKLGGRVRGKSSDYKSDNRENSSPKKSSPSSTPSKACAVGGPVDVPIPPVSQAFGTSPAIGVYPPYFNYGFYPGFPHVTNMPANFGYP